MPCLKHGWLLALSGCVLLPPSRGLASVRQLTLQPVFLLALSPVVDRVGMPSLDGHALQGLALPVL